MSEQMPYTDNQTPDPDRLAKIKYVEEQATRLLEFRFESLDLLTKEAQTTINWLFALMISTAGYALTEIKNSQWWLVVPLVAAAGASAYEVWRLMRDALQIKSVPSMGNEPNTLANEEILAQDEAAIRHGNILSMQTRIDDIRKINLAKGAAINRARQSMVIIPMGAMILAALILFIELLSEYLPCAYRP